eukprot:TRINITY_DN71462_c0_g1_i1.p1 TRINITY_DN71462_c0_g1~~TRINITY_DN71462_c0_g1_i1.p1  ORF type:complete len:319 (-),score=51.63 TRINITY_DN71462_c0_g1_i1:67-1023(-)
MNAFLQAETDFLVRKRNGQQRQPLEIFGAATLATLAFMDCYLAMTFSMRYNSYSTALLCGPVLCVLMTLGIGYTTYWMHSRRRAFRGLLIITLCFGGGTIAGYLCGDNAWWKYTVYYYNYQDMASYVNVDPGLDVGQSFMDAGTVYFKESSYVLTRKALAFRNGATFCVAPIVRQPVQMIGQSNPNVLNTVTGFSAPRSGTVDFWAVGTDCCGKTGTDEPFTCFDAASPLARSGTRVLNNKDRSMFLLAVQEWSASTGLPVRHPIFFHYVKDPVQNQESYYRIAYNDLWVDALITFAIALVAGLFLEMVFQKMQIRGR